MSLTPKQAAFAREYMVDLNATQAAIRAGYSKRTAYSMGDENLKKPEIAAAVAEAQAARAKRTEITADRVLQELAKIGFADVRRIFGPGGGLLDPTSLDDETASAVQSVEVVARSARGQDGETAVEHVHKIKLNDKLAALTQIGRHLGMFTDRQELTGRGGGPIETIEHTNLDRAKALVDLLEKVKAELASGAG